MQICFPRTFQPKQTSLFLKLVKWHCGFYCLDFACIFHRISLTLFLYWLDFLHAFSQTFPTFSASFCPPLLTPFFPPAPFQDTVQPKCGRQASWWTCAHRVVCQHAPEKPTMVSAGLAAWLSLGKWHELVISSLGKGQSPCMDGCVTEALFT